MKKINPLLELSALMTEDSSLVSEVQLAENQPLNYLGQFAGALQERGIDSAIPELSWLALVDGLAHRNLLEELDWKDDPEALIATAMKLLADHADYDVISEYLLKVEPFIDEDIEEFLPQLNSELKKFDVQLVWLDIDSDSYPLAILSSDKIEEAIDLALEAGYGTIKT